jgi:hypothetical protein
MRCGVDVESSRVVRELLRYLAGRRCDARVTAEEIIFFVGTKLAGFKKPKSVEFVPEITKNV